MQHIFNVQEKIDKQIKNVSPVVSTIVARENRRIFCLLLCAAVLFGGAKQQAENPSVFAG